MWPSQYIAPAAAAAFQQVSAGDPTVVGHHWSLSRLFQNGEITAAHLGASKAGSFDLLQLAPDLAREQYELLHAPKLGTWDEPAKTYRAGNDAGVDYFLFGAQPDGSGFQRKLIAVSARIFD